jgi:demethylmenaquinone methyltransferase/2-methoxy-6-polyprenyl-1,4-benzoquinol methylase
LTRHGSPEPPERVRQLFDRIAPRYDQLNDLLSLGQHRLWKRQTLALLRPQPGERWLDLCCGTGDLALLLAERVRPGGQVLGLDAAAAPLALARTRSEARPWLALEWSQADALAVPEPDASFDGAVMAYGLRNLPDAAAALAELRRLLAPGGRAAVLDFNRTEGLPAAVQRLALRRLVVPVARRAGFEAEYAYLERSLATFPSGAEQERLALAAGFGRARHRPLAGGLMGVLLLAATA